MKPSDMRLCAATLSTQLVPYRTPIKFGGRVMSEVLLLDVMVEAETRDGRRGRGRGSMPLGNVWAWPSTVAGPSETQNVMLALAEELVRQANDDRQFGHPLEITHRLAASHAETSRRVADRAGSPEPIPKLAQLVAASPLEAAIHDAFGKIIGRNSFDLLGPEWVNTDIAAYLDNQFAGEYLDRYTLRARGRRCPCITSSARSIRSACRPGQPRRRRPAGNAGRMDRHRRTHTSENQAQRRRSGVGRRAGVVGRTRGGRGPGGPGLSRLAIFGRFQ